MRDRQTFSGDPIERRFPPHADSGKMALLISDWPH
jgi:hypothetical protein